MESVRRANNNSATSHRIRTHGCRAIAGSKCKCCPSPQGRDHAARCASGRSHSAHTHAPFLPLGTTRGGPAGCVIAALTVATGPGTGKENSWKMPLSEGDRAAPFKEREARGGNTDREEGADKPTVCTVISPGALGLVNTYCVLGSDRMTRLEPATVAT